MYEYDYENRITKIKKSGPITVAEYVYDAFGRRIKKTDSIVSSQSRIYYYNDKWQVLCEYGGRGFVSMLQWFAYGNYIDEPVFRGKQDDETPESTDLYFYVHDHLYSTVALVNRNQFTVVERYEYDAYGNCQIMDASYNPRSTSSYGNPYLFTGRTLDILDNGNLKIQYNRNRFYDSYTGRWLTHDPLGYLDSMNLYEYVNSDPVKNVDVWGLCDCTNFGFTIPVDADLYDSTSLPPNTMHLSFYKFFLKPWANNNRWVKIGGDFLDDVFGQSEMRELFDSIDSQIRSEAMLIGTNIKPCSSERPLCWKDRRLITADLLSTNVRLSLQTFTTYWCADCTVAKKCLNGRTFVFWRCTTKYELYDYYDFAWWDPCGWAGAPFHVYGEWQFHNVGREEIE